MQEAIQFKAGDRVRHEKRPEWGVGTIQRAENIRVGEKPTQRLVIRFANAGLKTLSTLGADLAHLNGQASHAPPNGSETLLDREAQSETGWLGEISKRNPEDAMTQLPEEATDPFSTPIVRLKKTIALYRYQPDGRGLSDWAVARSGLDDPLSRFTRHELEQFFDRWRFLRDKHLVKVLEEARNDDPQAAEAILAQAPPAAKHAVSKSNARR